MSFKDVMQAIVSADDYLIVKYWTRN